MELRKETINWFNQAEEDWESAEILLKNKKFFAAAFFCQQAAEKALKSLYLKEMKKPATTHNLVELGRELHLEEWVLNTCKLLTPHFIISRYPDAAGALPADLYEQKETARLLEETKKVLE